MLQVYNEVETELICKIIDSTGKFYALFRDSGYYGSFLIVADDTSNDIKTMTKLVYEDEGSSCFFIDMKNYLNGTDTSPIKVINGKQYILGVKCGGGKFERNYIDCEDDPDEQNMFEYFYPEQYGKAPLTIEEEIARTERQMEKYHEQRMKSKGGSCLELPSGGKFYNTQLTIIPLTKKKL